VVHDDPAERRVSNLGVPVKALVTGHLGFIGRHVTRALEDAGYAVMGIDLADGGDARDFFLHCGGSFDLVVHAAAAGADRATIDGDPLVLASNLELDAGLFQWALRARPGRVVYLSSSAAYPVVLQLGPDHALCETDISWSRPRKPDGIYGQIKLMGEMLAEEARYRGLNVSVVRPFSGYGEDQDPARFPFPALASRAVAREDPFTVWGSGQQVRDFVHVDDIVAAILVMVREGIDGPVNIGTGRPVSMTELGGMFATAAGYAPMFAPKPTAPAGVAYRVSDTTRLSEFYAPKVCLEDGVARMMATVA